MKLISDYIPVIINCLKGGGGGRGEGGEGGGGEKGRFWGIT